MPFADFDSMEECKREHSDKDDPGAYCAQIHYEATGEWPGQGDAEEKSLVGRVTDYLEDVAKAATGGSGGGGTWVPYEGPRGGSGWVESGTGRRVYGDKPPGDAVDIDAMDAGAASPLTADTEMEPGGLLVAPDGDKAAVIQADDNIVKIAMPSGETARMNRADMADAGAEYAPPDAGGDESAPEGVTDTDFGTDFTGVRTVRGHAEADADTVQAVERTLREKHGSAAVGEMANMRKSWKASSYSDRARAREEVFKEALGLDGDVRNHGLDTDMRGTDAVHDVARDTTEASRRFMRENYADEDGNIEVHRGLSRRVGARVQAELFSRVGTGEDGGVSINLNSMDNYSVDREMAGRWGGSTATITEERPVEDVVVATDMLMEGRLSEGEVAMEGGTREISGDDMDVMNDIPAGELVKDPSEHDDRTLRQVAVAASEFLNNAADDERVGRDKYPDPTPALDNIERIAEVAEARAEESSEANERAVSLVSEAIDTGGERFPQDALADAAREELSGSDWAEISISMTGTEPVEVAEQAVDAANTTLDDDDFDRFMRSITGETVEGTSNVGLAVEAEELNAALEQARRQFVDEKSDEVGDSYDVDATDDPANIDWLAMAGDGKGPDAEPAYPAPPAAAEQKGDWVPYSGPRGGSGWKNLSSGEVVYEEEAPGETINVDELPERVWDYGGIDDVSEGDVVQFLDEDLEDDFGLVEQTDGMDLTVTTPDGESKTISDFDLQASLDLERAAAADEGTMTTGAIEESLSGLDVTDMENRIPELLGEGADPDDVADVVIDEVDGWEADNLDIVASSILEDAEGSSGGDSSSYRTMPGDDLGATDQLIEERGYDAEQNVRRNLQGWVGPMFTEETAPMWQYMASETGNTNIPETAPTEGETRAAMLDDVEPKDGDTVEEGDEVWFHDAMRGERDAVVTEVNGDTAMLKVQGEGLLDEPVEPEEAEDFEAMHKASTEALREAFGDEMTVFRGYSENPANPSAADATSVSGELNEAAEEDEEVSMGHRPGESWTTDPKYAASYADEEYDGAVVTKDVPVERVAISAHTSPLGSSESEVVVMHDEEETYEPDQIATASDDDFEEQLFRHSVAALSKVVNQE